MVYRNFIDHFSLSKPVIVFYASLKVVALGCLIGKLSPNLQKGCLKIKFPQEKSLDESNRIVGNQHMNGKVTSGSPKEAL